MSMKHEKEVMVIIIILELKTKNLYLKVKKAVLGGRGVNAIFN